MSQGSHASNIDLKQANVKLMNVTCSVAKSRRDGFCLAPVSSAGKQLGIQLPTLSLVSFVAWPSIACTNVEQLGYSWLLYSSHALDRATDGLFLMCVCMVVMYIRMVQYVTLC